MHTALDLARGIATGIGEIPGAEVISPIMDQDGNMDDEGTANGATRATFHCSVDGRTFTISVEDEELQSDMDEMFGQINPD